MTSYHVDSAAVAAATGAIQATMGRIQSEVSLLDGRLVELQGVWGGQAALAFQSTATEWKATQQRVEQALGQIAAALAHAGRQYEEIELQNARLFVR